MAKELTAQMAKRLVALRRNGKSFEEISDLLNVPVETARKWVSQCWRFPTDAPRRIVLTHRARPQQENTAPDGADDKNDAFKSPPPGPIGPDQWY